MPLQDGYAVPRFNEHVPPSDVLPGLTVNPSDVAMFAFVLCEKGDKSANERSAWFDYTASMIEAAQAEVTQASLISIPF